MEPTTLLTPEQIVEQLRTLQAQIGPVAPLTPAQRRAVRRQARTPQPVVEASINVIGVSDTVAGAVGVPAAEVRQMVDEVSRWTAVEAELRKTLDGVAGANLMRRQRINTITGNAYQIGTKLARAGHTALVPQVQEVKRLKSFSRRKKRDPQSPEPAPAPSPALTDETRKV